MVDPQGSSLATISTGNGNNPANAQAVPKANRLINVGLSVGRKRKYAVLLGFLPILAERVGLNPRYVWPIPVCRRRISVSSTPEVSNKLFGKDWHSNRAVLWLVSGC
jgi:hypothetical protein